MKNQKTIRDLHEQWERGAQRAFEDTRRADELAKDELNTAAGLHVQSGVKGGFWSVTCGNCTNWNTCTCQSALCNG